MRLVERLHRPPVHTGAVTWRPHGHGALGCEREGEGRAIEDIVSAASAQCECVVAMVGTVGRPPTAPFLILRRSTRLAYRHDVEQRIAFLQTERGRVAFASVGEGSPLLLGCWWIGHLELQWESVTFRGWIERLAARHTVLWYDRPGTGLSTPGRIELNVADEAAVSAAVLEAVDRRRSSGLRAPAVRRSRWRLPDEQSRGLRSTEPMLADKLTSQRFATRSSGSSRRTGDSARR